MYTIKIVYNSLLEKSINLLELLNTLEDFFSKDHIEIYDENNYGKERKKALQIKNVFGAKLSPFIGIYTNKKIIKGFYSEDDSCTIDNITKYLNENMGKIDRPEIPVALVFTHPRFKKILELRKLSKEEFLKDHPDEEDIYDAIYNSKTGFITITKISDNPGYLSNNETVSGYTAGFGEGMSCFIDCISNYYYTSTIQKIDWENNIFYTLNSKYSFEFNESDIEGKS